MGYRDKTLITVLLPVANIKYLESTLKSINEQTLSGQFFNLLVINDGNDRESIDKVLRFSYNKSAATIIDSNKSGIVGALNTGLLHCQTKYIARIDQDDLMLKNRLKIQLEYLEAHNEVLCVGGQIQLIDTMDKSIGFAYYPKSNWLIKKTISLTSPMAHPAVMFRRNVVGSLGGYRAGIPEDWDLWVRLAEVGRIVNLDEFMIKYRIHGEQLSRTRLYQSEFARCLIKVSAILRSKGLKDCPNEDEDLEVWLKKNVVLAEPDRVFWKLHIWNKVKKLNTICLSLKYRIKSSS